MYVTRPLSLYKNNPDLLFSPPEGPNSGILVILDEEAETTCCFGLCKNTYIDDLPLPQNKRLTVRYSTSSGENSTTYTDETILIPVLNQPLSSNRYYAIETHGRHKGEAHTSSKEEDMKTCCFCNCISDVKPRALDFNDPYQQFEISRLEGCCSSSAGFTAKSVGPDGFPPTFLRRRGWGVSTKTPKNFQLGEANGLDNSLRARLPNSNISVSCKTSEPVVVGKWYCPFMFVKEESLPLKDQVRKSPYYELTLEQKWEQIFSCENNSERSNGKVVDVDVRVQTEVISIAGREIQPGDSMEFNGEMRFKGSSVVGLSMSVVKSMKWEQERFGCDTGDGKKIHARVKRVEEFAGEDGWSRFGCYVLVESFVLKRNDGSLVMTYDFKHTNRTMSKWE